MREQGSGLDSQAHAIACTSIRPAFEAVNERQSAARVSRECQKGVQLSLSLLPVARSLYCAAEERPAFARNQARRPATTRLTRRRLAQLSLHSLAHPASSRAPQHVHQDRRVRRKLKGTFTTAPSPLHRTLTRTSSSQSDTNFRVRQPAFIAWTLASSGEEA